MSASIVLLRPSIFTVKKNCLINLFQPTRQFKSALKIKWVRPEKVPCIKPEMSGDLKPLGTIDLKQFPMTHKPSKELQSASETVQRIYTLEFFPRQKLKEEFMIEYSNRVKSHQLDDDSPEVRVAKMTVKIRNLQIHIDNYPYDTINKVRLKETIEKRNRRLSVLRRTDYKKYEWLLEQLDLIHKVFEFKGSERVERKKSLRRLTALFMVKLKSERLEEYKASLEVQKEGFLMEKLEKLISMKNTEEECGIIPSISDADIEAARKQLENFQTAEPKEDAK